MSFQFNPRNTGKSRKGIKSSHNIRRGISKALALPKVQTRQCFTMHGMSEQQDVLAAVYRKLSN